MKKSEKAKQKKETDKEKRKHQEATISVKTHPSKPDIIHKSLLLNQKSCSNYFWETKEGTRIAARTILLECNPLVIGQGTLCLIRFEQLNAFFTTVVELIGNSFRSNIDLFQLPPKQQTKIFKEEAEKAMKENPENPNETLNSNKMLEAAKKMNTYFSIFKTLYPRQEEDKKWASSSSSSSPFLSSCQQLPSFSSKNQKFNEMHPYLAEKLFRNVFWESALGFCLYHAASYINHSCVPNSTWLIDSKTGDFKVQSLFPIEEKTKLTISYHSVRFLDRKTRSEFLHTTYGFDCSCLVCSFPESKDEKMNFAFTLNHLLLILPWTSLEEMRLRRSIMDVEERKKLLEERELRLRQLSEAKANRKKQKINTKKSAEEFQLETSLIYPLYCTFCGTAPTVTLKNKSKVEPEPKPEPKLELEPEQEQEQEQEIYETKLKKCSNCRLVAFCNTDCQRKALHFKKQCMALREYFLLFDLIFI